MTWPRKVSLTAKAEGARLAAMASARAVNRDALEALSPKERRAFIGKLAKVVAHQRVIAGKPERQ